LGLPVTSSFHFRASHTCPAIQSNIQTSAKKYKQLSDYRPTKSKENPIQTEKSGTRKLDEEQCETS
jgi:hypothetical protein